MCSCTLCRACAAGCPFSHQERKILRHALHILEKYDMGSGSSAGSSDAGGAHVDDELYSVLRCHDTEVGDIDAWVAELKREQEEEKLQQEEEVFWADIADADWCQRCLRYLATDPLHICEFAGRLDKCSRCIAQGRSGAACVEVSYT